LRSGLELSALGKAWASEFWLASCTQNLRVIACLGPSPTLSDFGASSAPS